MNEPGRTLEEAAERLKACRDMEPEAGQQCFHDAYVLVIQVRNRLLQAREQQRLAKLNALLSLISSVQFPLAGVHHDRLDAVIRNTEQLASDLASSGR